MNEVKNKIIDLFQFLIGILKTKNNSGKGDTILSEFQFLIGILKTKERRLPHEKYESGFNSL